MAKPGFIRGDGTFDASDFGLDFAFEFDELPPTVIVNTPSDETRVEKKMRLKSNQICKFRK